MVIYMVGVVMVCGGPVMVCSSRAMTVMSDAKANSGGHDVGPTVCRGSHIGLKNHHGCHAEPRSPSQLFSGARESVRLTVQGLRAILVVSWGPQRAYRD